MGTVRRLETQTEAFWRDEYQVSAADEDLLASMILEGSSSPTHSCSCGGDHQAAARV